MLRAFALLLAALVFATPPADAQSPGAAAVLSPARNYIGDLTGSALTFSYSVRRVNGGYGGALFNLECSTNDLVRDFFPAGNDTFPVGDAKAFCPGGNLTIHIAYTQQLALGCNAVQATLGDQPKFILSASPSGQPAMGFTAGPQWLLTPCTPSLSTPFSTSVVAQRTGAFTAVGFIWSANSASGFAQLDFNSTANQVFIYAGNFVTVAQNDNVMHVIGTLFNSGTSMVAIDGSVTTGDSGTHDFGSNQLAIGYNPAFLAQPLTGYLAELPIWNAGLSTAMFASYRINQKAFYRTP